MADTPLGKLLSLGPKGLGPDLLREIGEPILTRNRARVPYEMDDDDLVQAAMTALLLGQPLILAGNPGVGKTQFAIALAERLDLKFLTPHQVKSSDEGRDLLFNFDQVGRYRAGEDSPLASHVNFTALGLGILRSAGPDTRIDFGSIPVEKMVGQATIDAVTARNGAYRLADLFPEAFEKTQTLPQRCVVLLDELDKAPRDAPNDILGEIESMRFRIPELDISIKADPEHWPVVMITTNSEQSLPDPFLRRCIFHWIADPSRARLIQIVALHLSHSYQIDLQPNCPFLDSAVDIFLEVARSQLNKRPGTAEFVSFVFALWERKPDANHHWAIEDQDVKRAIGTLLKTRSDRLKYVSETDAGHGR
jgi:MoxR-like ATPase